MIENYGTIWVCVCCLLMHANGECCSNEQHGGDGCEPLSRIESPYSVSAGMSWEDHSEDCLAYRVSELKAEYPVLAWPDVVCDRDCETNTYSTSQCEGCGSWLHGERHAMTLFGPAEESADA